MGFQLWSRCRPAAGAACNCCYSSALNMSHMGIIKHSLFFSFLLSVVSRRHSRRHEFTASIWFEELNQSSSLAHLHQLELAPLLLEVRITKQQRERAKRWKAKNERWRLSVHFHVRLPTILTVSSSCSPTAGQLIATINVLLESRICVCVCVRDRQERHDQGNFGCVMEVQERLAANFNKQFWHWNRSFGQNILVWNINALLWRARLSVRRGSRVSVILCYN